MDMLSAFGPSHNPILWVGIVLFGLSLVLQKLRSR